ncbi:MAG: DNA polymerase I [Gammaproteobacteria bacterium RIFOXYA12_FULL_61_12]|nr:MAG: DNA polymerase I [Gammaproteobacteria bacterium RIFOXYD12_FULL_61_37]OGT92615.1 MAG: DNA polymerase I [Gammaproteobacteria bacterium RIFOXYA12_FULL_61_12]
MPQDKPLILVDGSSYLYRAYHALPPLTNSKGEPTGAVVGVVNMLKKLLDEYRPSHMAVIFDAPGPTFRDELYSQYKAHRPPAPEDLKAQIPLLHEVVRAMGFPLIMESGVEADDVIGTLAVRAAGPVLISSGDKDIAQLVNDRVSQVDTMSERVFARQGVLEKFGVSPEQIVDYLALIGDASDNVPGVPKCGPKTAVKWLHEYGSIDGLVAHSSEISGKIGENLRAALDQLPLSRNLVTLKLDVPLPQAPEELCIMPPDKDRLRSLFEGMGARRLLAGLDNTPGEEAPSAERSTDTANYSIILDPQEFERWLARLQEAELFAFDTETTSLDYMQAELVGLSFALQPGEAAYVPLAHTAPGTPPQLDRAWVLERLKPLLEDPGRPKVMQNLKYDMSVLARYAIGLRGVAHDTMLESYMLDAAGRHDMDSLAQKYLGLRTIKFEDVAGKGAKQLGFDEVPLENAGPYAAEDADVTLRLHRHLWRMLEPEKALSTLYSELELPLASVLSRMERIGVRIDAPMLQAQSHLLARRMIDLEQRAYSLAGHPFNLGSPKQIAQVFFEEMGLKPVSHTPTGAPSTAESVLEELALGHELPRVLLEHRGLSKLKSTYTDKLPQMVNPVTGRVHTSYHQAVAATGRLSSSDPNLQNIPVRSEEGRRIRQAFVPEPGYRMVAADYSQIELRIMAHLSGDQNLLKAFASGADIHRATAAEVFTGGDMAAVTPEQRRSAKAINFGLIYGMSAFGLAQQLGIGRASAQQYVDLYFQRYPGVKVFMDRIREEAHRSGYVETLFGRRLYLAEINSRNGNRRAAAERTAINAPMQGTAADIIKRAMLAVDRWIQQEAGADRIRMLMQVHDELVFEIPEDLLEPSIERIRQLMEGAAELRVPLLVDIGVGGNWDEAH